MSQRSRRQLGLLGWPLLVAVAYAGAPGRAAACGSKIDFTQDCCNCVFSTLNKQCEYDILDPCDICDTVPCGFPSAARGLRGTVTARSCEVSAEPAAPPAGSQSAVVVELKART